MRRKPQDEVEIVVDPEFSNLMFDLAPDEYERLEASCVAETIRDRLVVWKDHNILLEGHNRLAIAKAHDLPVILHTPIRLAPQGKTVLPQVAQIIKEEGFPVERCVFDHAGEESLAYRAATGGMMGLSICWDKMPPEPAAQYVIDHPELRDKIVINSELGGEGNDYFMVPRVILAMKLFGLDKATIDKVCYQNPRDFFKLPVD